MVGEAVGKATVSGVISPGHLVAPSPQNAAGKCQQIAKEQVLGYQRALHYLRFPRARVPLRGSLEPLGYRAL